MPGQQHAQAEGREQRADRHGGDRAPAPAQHPVIEPEPDSEHGEGHAEIGERRQVGADLVREKGVPDRPVEDGRARAC